jgi:hypothetical protein
MTEVVSRSRMPSVPRSGCPAPVEVLFKRGVKAASVAATGDAATPSQGSLGSSVRARVSQSTPVACVLGVLRGVGGVASKFRVGPSLTAPVASAYLSPACSTARYGSPASTLPLVLRSLKRRAAAAKVSRGRRRLGGFPEPSGWQQGAYASSPAPRPTGSALRSSGVELREFGSVALRCALRQVASCVRLPRVA